MLGLLVVGFVSACCGPTGGTPVQRDLVIVTIGNSYAAGEGTPDMKWNEIGPNALPVVEPIWDLRAVQSGNQSLADEAVQCHRSNNSGPVLAAAALDALNGVSVTFRSFACSGATIDSGILGEHRGIFHRTRNFPLLDRQIDQVRSWMIAEGINNIDALIVYAGGNDVGFGPIIANCLDPFIGDCSTDPETLTLFIAGDGGRVIGFFQLPDAFARLNTAIQAELSPGNTFIAEYPPLVKNKRGRYCDGFDDGFLVESNLDPVPVITLPGYSSRSGTMTIGLGAGTQNISRSENKWVYESVALNLNNAIKTAAETHGWNFMEGIGELGDTHGYCAADRWVNTLKDSWFAQMDMFGAVHPNEKGQEAYGDVLIKHLIEVLGVNDAPDLKLMSMTDDSRAMVGSEEVQFELTFEIEFAPTANQLEDITFEYSINDDFTDSTLLRRGPDIDTHFPELKFRNLFTVRFQESVPTSDRYTGQGPTIFYRWRVDYKKPGLSSRRFESAVRSIDLEI